MSPLLVVTRVFQSTHPCGVRRHRHYHYRYNSVSIHAPVWGATGWLIGASCWYNVSIHAPVWGATVMFMTKGFSIVVSIHAPVWGATFNNTANNTLFSVSIHAPVWGATRTPGRFKILPKFQSTHPCGVRQAASSQSDTWYRFNPRTRVGCDQRTLNLYPQVIVSIHAPVWGATHNRYAISKAVCRFNPRTRVGCDLSA